MLDYERMLNRLKTSKFRSRFHLTEKDRAYVREKGLETLAEHALAFVRQRLAPAEIPNDGRQTPMRGHPVFLAQHACACCCRDCLRKWYRVPKGVALTEFQQRCIVELLMRWISHEMEKDSPPQATEEAGQTRDKEPKP
ncbi:DUF4186 domain-containing protein [uncultured Mailhella sp.]|uniref:DUF4186 domain-containing protein n=1 Tax=uncultured Mailhella sp. TaxID=1981031 RepID=UPI00261C3FE3|nr:DUF4186 domain-containing protein [uncultured Mailhella sp.]